MQQSSGGFRLIVRRGPQPNQIYDLNKDVITIGRDITNDITINDPEVSRHHARLTRREDGFAIEDLGSTNGTFVNGQRLTGMRPLAPGETIGLGETVTLAYEATAIPSGLPPQAQVAPPPQQPMQRPPEIRQASPYAPPPPPPPSGAMQQTYTPPPQYADQPPPSPYTYAEEPPSGGGMTRWFVLGCTCFIVLCVIGAVVAVIVIDQTCGWNQEPLKSLLEAVNLGADETIRACQ